MKKTTDNTTAPDNIDQIIRCGENLQIEDEFFKAIFENSKDAIFWAECSSGTLVNCNRSARQLVQRPRDQIIGKHFSVLHPVEDIEKIERYFNRFASGQIADEVEVSVLTSSGIIKYASISPSVTVIGGNKIMQGIFHEITERKRAERLRILQRDIAVELSSEIELCKALDSVLGHLVRLDQVDCGGVYLVDEQTGCLKLRAKKNIPADLLEYIDNIACDDIRYKALSNGNTLTNDDFSARQLKRYKKDRGVVKYFCAVPVMHQSALVGSVNLAAEKASIPEDIVALVESIASKLGDIIKRIQAEQSLRQSQAQMRALIESLPFYFWAVDLDLNYTMLNAASIEKMGNCIGKNVRDCGTPKELLDAWLKIAEMVIQENKYHHTYKANFEGALRTYDCFCSPVIIEGKTVGILGIDVEITEKLQMEQKLSYYQRQMFRAEQLASVGTLSATIAHELNQPLTVMKLYLQQGQKLLQDKQNDSRGVLEKIENCLYEIENASNIVNRFRNFARKSSVTPESMLDVGEIIKNVSGAFALLCRQNDVDLETTIPGSPLMLRVNRIELEQILFVLIQNAVQAGRDIDGAALKIILSSNNGMIRIVVSDTCGGIPDEQVDKIFDPFFTTKPANQGTGLGLCILKRIVEKLSGTVKVESEFTKGTKFIIDLPPRSA